MNTEVKVPDIGDYEQVEVIDVLVQVGDKIDADTILITLETDKATMDIPASVVGVISALKVQAGHKVSKGDVILTLETEKSEAVTSSTSPVQALPHDTKTSVIPISLPDLGIEDAKVIDINVQVGQKISQEEIILTLESDKASMDIPAPESGVITAILVTLNQVVQAGLHVMTLETSVSELPSTSAQVKVEVDTPVLSTQLPYASPAVRRFARQNALSLTGVVGSGRKGRILKTDLVSPVAEPVSLADLGDTPVDKFGPIRIEPLSRIKKISGKALQRSWTTIPHVTQFDEADITELESFRQAQKASAAQQQIKLTMLPFIMKAVVKTLQAFPTVNATLHEDGQSLTIKEYFHIGVAVDTADGLVVPVIRDVDKKSIYELAVELGQISTQARAQKLRPQDMQGGSFTISSLGGVGGTAFTPIVNLPEVAILGVSKAGQKPVYQQGSWVPRLMLPLSFSYDHRVIDGAQAARFTTHLAAQLTDIRRILL